MWMLLMFLFQGNFYEASNFCRSHCMHLISIESEAEQKGITKYLKRLGKQSLINNVNYLPMYYYFLMLIKIQH